jgi:hypothetical protein
MSKPLANLHLAMPLALAQAVANYLQTRPYREVVDLIDGMQKMQPVPAAAAQSDPPESPAPQAKASESVTRSPEKPAPALVKS